MRPMRWVLATTGFAVAAAVLPVTAARRQVGVYAAFSESKLTVVNTGWIGGATFGAYYDALHLPLVNFGVDARGSLLGGSGASQVKSGLVGPRAVAHLPIVPLRPYAEALVGAVQVQFGQGWRSAAAPTRRMAVRRDWISLSSRGWTGVRWTLSTRRFLVRTHRKL